MSWFTKLIGVDKAIEKAFEERGLGGELLNIFEFDRSFQLLENEMHYKGTTEEIIRFYQKKRPHNNTFNTNLFWRVVSTRGNLPVQHFPLATMITKAKVGLLFNESPTFELDDAQSKEWDAIAKENDFAALLKKAGEMRSYSGSVVFVPVMDETFSDKVIIRVYPRERYHAIKKYGKTIEVVVTEEYKANEKRYILAIKYGKGTIDYSLLNDKGKEVPLSTLEETKDLAPQKYGDESLFVEVLNNLDGQSDYFGIIDDFSALDECYSALTDIVRKGHIKTYIPKAKAVKGVDGEQYAPDDYTENVQLIPMANPTNAPYKTERDVVSLNENVQALTTAFNETLHHALLTTGVSPASMGLELAGANSSGEALNIRERQSMRTRAEAIRCWSPALEKLVKLALFMQTGKKYEKDISVNFSEYESPTFDQKVDSISKAVDAGLMDRMTALRQLYPDKSDDELEEMMMLIEGGLPKTADDILDDEEKKLKDGEKVKPERDPEEKQESDTEE